MHLLSTVASWEEELSTDGDCPPEVQFLLSALDAVPESAADRRTLHRGQYRVRALLRLFTDAPESPPWRLYVRNVNERAMGFVCADRLPLGYGGIIIVPALDKRILRIHSTILRCREATPGWYDGALYFNRPQVDLRVEPRLEPEAAARSGSIGCRTPRCSLRASRSPPAGRESLPAVPRHAR